MIITMALHPRGGIAPAQVEALVPKLLAVHSVALVSSPLLFLGACGIARRLGGGDRLSWAGLVFYGTGAAALLSGVVLDGLVEPKLLKEIVGATGQTHELWRAIAKYNAVVDTAFVLVYVVAAGVAILLWSAAIVKNNKSGLGTAVYGIVLGMISVVGVLAGFVSPETHAFAMVIVGQAAWFLWMAGRMWKSREVVGETGGT